MGEVGWHPSWKHWKDSDPHHWYEWSDEYPYMSLDNHQWLRNINELLKVSSKIIYVNQTEYLNTVLIKVSPKG